MEDQRGRLAAALDDLEYHRAVGVDSRMAEARRVEREAAAAGAIDLQMRAQLVCADMLQRTGQVTEAARQVMEVNAWAGEHGPASLLARSHLVLSSTFETIGDPAFCLDHAVRAVELLDAGAPPRLRGNFVLRLADALAVAGSFEAARERYREAESLFVVAGDLERRLNVLNNLAYAEYEAGHAEPAWSAAQEFCTLSERNGKPLNPSFLDTLARTQIARGRPDEAEASVHRAIAALAADGDVQAVTPAELLLTLAEAQRLQGRLDTAQATLERCRQVCVRRMLRRIEVDMLRERAALHAAAGEFEQAYLEHTRFHHELLRLTSDQRQSAARTRHALFETAEARQEAQRFWRQARTDQLTGLPNRRYLDEELPVLLGRAGDRHPVLVAIIDADDFKRINDTVSHAAGDAVIRTLGRLIRSGLEADTASETMVARLGGDEFMVVIQAPPALARATLERIRHAVTSHSWRPITGSLDITLSIGATFASEGDTESSVLARADRNLYTAKSSGKNSIQIDPDPAG